MSEIAFYLPGIILAYTAFLLAIASPGPNVLAIMGTSMSIGRGEGLSLAMGVATGTLIWSTLAVTGLTAILTQYASALLFIKIFGGLYLLWLAYKAFKSAASNHDIEAKTLEGGALTRLQYAKRGLIIQMTNPKAAMAWIAIVSLGLQSNAPAWVGLAIILGTFALSVLAHVLYALAFSTPVMIRAYGRARRTIQATLGAFFAFAGLKLLTSRS